MEAFVEEAGEMGGQDPHLETTAIFYSDVTIDILAFSSSAGQPVSRFAIGKLWRG